MADEEVLCGGCEEPIEGKPYRTIQGVACCSPRCGGRVLARTLKPAKKTRKDKTHRQIRNAMLKENKALGINLVEPKPTPVPFILQPEDGIKSSNSPGWGKVEFERNVFVAHEITILVRVTADSQPRIFGNMLNALAYTDPTLGLLLRPNMGSIKHTFQDFPKALSIAKKRPVDRHKEEETPQPKYRKPEPPKTLTPVEGASFGNICQDPSSKRYWLVESMLKGGDSKQIVARAAELAAEAGFFETKDDYLEKMPSNYMAINKMFTWLKSKLNSAGIRHRIIEVEGSWNVELVAKR